MHRGCSPAGERRLHSPQVQRQYAGRPWRRSDWAPEDASFPYCCGIYRTRPQEGARFPPGVCSLRRTCGGGPWLPLPRSRGQLRSRLQWAYSHPLPPLRPWRPSPCCIGGQQFWVACLPVWRPRRRLARLPRPRRCHPQVQRRCPFVWASFWRTRSVAYRCNRIPYETRVVSPLRDSPCPHSAGRGYRLPSCCHQRPRACLLRFRPLFAPDHGHSAWGPYPRRHRGSFSSHTHSGAFRCIHILFCPTAIWGQCAAHWVRGRAA